VETPRASLSSPKTSAEHLIEAVRVEGSDEGTADSSPLLPKHLVDPAMVAEVVEHVRTLLKERARQLSESGGDGGDGGGGASGGGAEDARTAAAEGNGEDGGGERKDTGTAELSQATSAAAPWWTLPALGSFLALRKRSGRVVKLVPVEEDTKGTELSKDGSIILRDETMLVDRIHSCAPRLGQCIEGMYTNHK
jgi:hypothetical protein